MKPLLFLLATLPLAGQSVPFSYNFTGTTLCTPVVQRSCLLNFEVSWQPPAPITLSTGTMLSGPPMVIAIPPGTTGTVGFTAVLSGLPWGTYTVSVVIVGKDANGARVTSDPAKAQVTVQVPLPPPVVGTPTASVFGSSCRPDPLTPDSAGPNGDCWWDCFKVGYVTCGWGSFAVTGASPGEIPKRS